MFAIRHAIRYSLSSRFFNVDAFHIIHQLGDETIKGNISLSVMI